MNEDRIQVILKGVVPTPGGAGIFLSADGKTMSIFVDPMATRALSLALEGEATPRPLTHDLLISIVGGLGVQLKEVFIHDFQEETYFARLTLEQENELGKNLLEIDARPSDGIILAMHLNVPITVAREVWEKTEDMSWALDQIQSKGI
jgi:bifunctional DNase/RNase